MVEIGNEKLVWEIFAENAITFEPCRFQKSYTLGLKIVSVQNFSAIFEVDPMKTPVDRTPEMKALRYENKRL